MSAASRPASSPTSATSCAPRWPRSAWPPTTSTPPAPVSPRTPSGPPCCWNASWSRSRSTSAGCWTRWWTPSTRSPTAARSTSAWRSTAARATPWLPPTPAGSIGCSPTWSRTPSSTPWRATCASGSAAAAATWSSPSPTRARGSRPRTCRTSSSASTGPTSTGPGPSAAPGWDWPSRWRTSTSTGARSTSRARSAAARPSPSPCRRSIPSPSPRTARRPSRSPSPPPCRRSPSVGSRRAPSLRPLVALATLLGLAACTAGVPQTGSVVVVSPVTSAPPPVDPEAFQDVNGPFSGQSDSEVAAGFMNAMNTGDVARIQRWVMRGPAQDQVAAWAKPTATVRVYSVYEPGPEQVSDQRRVVPIKVKLVGQLRDGRDWYPSTGEDLLSLELQRQGAEARVANPGSAIWMRDINFSKLYAPAEIYLAPDLADPVPHLAPVPVFVPNATEGGEETAAEVRVKGALKLLLAGPQGRYGNLSTAIPPGTTLNGFRYARDVVTLNLNRRFLEPGKPGQLRIGQLRVAQLVWTLNRLIPTASVRILVDGRPVRSVGIDQFRVDRRWNRQDE